MIVLGEIVQLQAYDSVPYPFATPHNQCSYVDCIDLLVSNPSFQDENRVDLEVAQSNDRWKRRRRKKWNKKG